jgi:hypothetical protein
MGPGFESQRDHKREAEASLFLCQNPPKSTVLKGFSKKSNHNK